LPFDTTRWSVIAAARDLTQAFFTSQLERRDIEHVRPDRGCFRTFLLRVSQALPPQ
jgi:hypothetical protein